MKLKQFNFYFNWNINNAHPYLGQKAGGEDNLQVEKFPAQLENLATIGEWRSASNYQGINVLRFLEGCNLVAIAENRDSRIGAGRPKRLRCGQDSVEVIKTLRNRKKDAKIFR